MQGVPDERGSVKVFDLTGRQLYDVNLSGDEFIHLGDELAAGVYILKYSGRNQQMTYRLTKQ